LARVAHLEFGAVAREVLVVFHQFHRTQQLLLLPTVEARAQAARTKPLVQAELPPTDTQVVRVALHQPAAEHMAARVKPVA
jgi:hypothetical protein